MFRLVETGRLFAKTGRRVSTITSSRDWPCKGSPYLAEAGVMKPLLPAVALLTAISAFSEEIEPSPKPRLQTFAEDVIQSRTVDLGERQVTFEKIRPLSLPSIPEPPEQVEVELSTEQLQAFEEAKKVQHIFLGVTVYIPDEGSEAAKSLVRYWCRQGEQPVSMWINANLLWVGAFAEYESEEVSYSLMMFPSEYRFETLRRVAALSGQEWQEPDIPEFDGDGTGEIRVIEGNPSEAELEPIKALMEHYRTDKVRLRELYEQRLAEAEQKRLEREADPPEKKDLRIRYWRLDAAGQQGLEPQPATIR